MFALTIFIQHCAENHIQGNKKIIHIVKEEVKLSLFINDIITDVENPKESTRRAPRTNKQVYQGHREYKIEHKHK